MRHLILALLVLCLSLISAPSFAAETTLERLDRGTYLSEEEVEIVRALVQEKRCLLTEKPTMTLDSVTIVTDKEGRVYYSGNEPKPFKVQLDWCNYQIQGVAPVKVLVLQDKPKEWGFRLRPKFFGGFLFLDAVERPSAAEGADLGLALDFFHWKNLNLNAQVGFRAVGASVGIDITRNFGALGGFGFSFWTLRPNPMVGLYFSF
jgi:hypothetical protein